ncbi:MAG: transglutaminase domain-containing protein [Acidobacteria bacterium]|nr:transglutaminase domain-containing protein [Acidobacteriota bacterium]
MTLATARSTLVALACTAALAAPAAARTTTSQPKPPGPGAAAPAPAHKSTRRVLFSYTTLYEHPPKDKQAFDVWVPIPVETEGQKVRDLVIYSPGDGGVETEPANGNRLTHFHSGPRGGVSININTRFTLEREEVRHPDLKAKPAVAPPKPANLATYLKGDRLAPIDADVKSLASKVTAGKAAPVDRARAIYDYVVLNIKYGRSGSGWGQGDLKYALMSKGGNCTDLNVVFEALARASGIPARMVTGFKLPVDAPEGSLTEHHCWSEFYLDGHGWIPVDPVDGAAPGGHRDYYFGNLDADRITYSVGRDIVLSPPQAGASINFLLYPYAEADGEPLSGAAYVFSWKEGPPAKP